MSMDQNAVRTILPIVFALLQVTASNAVEVSATRLDGTAVAGELKRWDDQEVVVETADGEQRMAIKELLSIRRSGAVKDAAPGGSTAFGQIELVDGSILLINDFTIRGTTATVALAWPLSEEAESVRVHKQQIRAVRLQPFDEALEEQWLEIRELKPAADVLVLFKRDGKSLDYVEGVLGEVLPEKVSFELDGDSMTVDRKKVAGMIHFRRDEDIDAEPRSVIHGRGDMKINVAHASLDKDSVQITTTGGSRFSWPLEEIEFIDFSSGKLVYLSDLEPVSKTLTPLAGLPVGAALASQYIDVRRDHSAYGGPLAVAWPDEMAASPEAVRNPSSKGLAIHSRTELVYRLPAGYRRLSALAGIDPACRANGSVKLEILGDDRPLDTSDIDGSSAPRAIDVDIAGVKRLKIVVDYGQNLDTGDWLNLCELRIVK